MSELEKRFTEDMQSIYIIAKKNLKYNATRFLQIISEKGAVQAAKVLISKSDGTYGFEVLWKNNRLDLSVEAHVLKDEYKELFTDEEREICRKRLREFNYNIDDLKR